ncbi:O-antigen ligase family protein [Acetitomaculum ruminis]|nr:O-antigen ligase family protein [Acetitomaculum ruminis]
MGEMRGNLDKKTDISWQEQLLNEVVFLYGVFVTVVFPILFHDRYNDILHAKAAAFDYVSIGAILFCGIVIISYLFSIRKLQDKKLKDYLKDLSIIDKFIIVFMFATTISFLINPNKYNTFWGVDGRRIGYLALMICGVSYFLYSRYLKDIDLLMILTFLAAVFISLIAIANHLGFDPLDMFVTMPKESQLISTLGNRDCLAGYIILLWPVSMFYIFKSPKKLLRIISWIYLLISFAAVVAAMCDSAYIAIFIIALVSLCFVFDNYKSLIGYCYIFLSFFAVHIVMKYLRNVREEYAWKAEGITEFLINNVWILALATVFFLLMAVFFTIMKKKEIDIGKFKVLRIIVWIAAFISIAFLIGLMIYVSSKYESKAECKEVFGTLANYIYFDESFGSSRGRIWNIALKTFLAMPFINKIFGYGPAGFRYALVEFLEESVYTFKSGRLIDAHNEFLQYLVTLGIFGIISYFGIFISAIIRFAKNRKKDFLVAGALVTTAAFLSQGIINNTHIYIEPLLFLLLAIAEAKIREVK